MSKENQRKVPNGLKDKNKRDQFLDVYNNIEKFSTVESVAQEIKISITTVERWVRILRRENYHVVQRTGGIQPSAPTSKEPLTFDEHLKVRQLKEQISRLSSDLKEAEKRALTSGALSALIHDIKGVSFNKHASWLKNPIKVRTIHGIPILFISDIHFDEYVDPAQIGYVNEYNRQVAIKRIQHTFKTAINILMNYVSNPKYDGLIICLGGDLLSGNIHEELNETNEKPIMKSIIDLTELLHQGISECSKIFKKVSVYCVVGNHGRLHKKPRMKNRVFDNFEWLIYQNLARQFNDNKDVNFVIPDGPDAVFTVYDKTFLLTHGDQFKGGSGISGIFTPLHLGLHRKQTKQAAIHASFDVMMLGHFHQYIHTNNIIVNGSIKGYCEFANMCNFTFQRPMQALWINNPELGMVMRTPILCDSYDGGYVSAMTRLKNL